MQDEQRQSGAQKGGGVPRLANLVGYQSTGFVRPLVARASLLAGLSLLACNVPAPPAPYDVTIVAVSDGGMPCALADAITTARLIRDPDSGLAVKVPCP